jgi:thermostable 8-oxoguanine DNA glycosylase
MNLPFIGGITKYHLARNIGLISCAKPDLHLCRWCGRITGREDEETVHEVTRRIAESVEKKQGTVDFAIWVWLSHNKGDELECCHGGFALR